MVKALTTKEMLSIRSQLFDDCYQKSIDNDLTVRQLITILASMASEMTYSAAPYKQATEVLNKGIRLGQEIYLERRKKNENPNKPEERKTATQRRRKR